MPRPTRRCFPSRLPCTHPRLPVRLAHPPQFASRRSDFPDRVQLGPVPTSPVLSTTCPVTPHDYPRLPLPAPPPPDRPARLVIPVPAFPPPPYPATISPSSCQTGPHDKPRQLPPPRADPCDLPTPLHRNPTRATGRRQLTPHRATTLHDAADPTQRDYPARRLPARPLPPDCSTRAPPCSSQPQRPPVTMQLNSAPHRATSHAASTPPDSCDWSTPSHRSPPCDKPTPAYFVPSRATSPAATSRSYPVRQADPTPYDTIQLTRLAGFALVIRSRYVIARSHGARRPGPYR